MKLITKEINAQLLANHAIEAADGGTGSIKPPLKLFLPWGAATWLISERDPENPDILFGLCDLGFGSPELGSVSLSELQSVKRFGLGIERDRYFKPTMTLAEYADKAREAGRIAA